QYQPEFGTVKRRSPRLGAPCSRPSSSMPTELIRLNRCAVSRLSKPRALACLNSVEMMVAITSSASMADTVEKATTRKARYRNGRLSSERPDRTTTHLRIMLVRARTVSILRLAHAIAHAAHRLDQVDAHLLAQTADEHLDRIGITVEILIVEVLYQFRARHHMIHMVHEIGKQPELVRGKLQRHAVHVRLRRLGVEPQRSAGQLGRGMARRTPDQRAHARQYLLDVERLGHVVVRPGVDARDLVA